jgi:hypothetical protein
MAKIEVLPQTLAGSPEAVGATLNGFADFLEEQSGRIEAAYGTGWGTGFAILNVDEIEEAWELLMSSPIYQFIRVEIVPLADPVRLMRSLVSNSLVPFARLAT